MYILCAVVVLALVGVARKSLFLIDLEGASMLPTLEPGDRLLALRYFPGRALRRGWIVVWQFEGAQVGVLADSERMQRRQFVKRIVGLPGDTVVTHIWDVSPRIRHQFAERYDAYGSRHWCVPPGHVFVRGDSPGYDSATVGAIPVNDLAGIVLLRFRRSL